MGIGGHDLLPARGHSLSGAAQRLLRRVGVRDRQSPRQPTRSAGGRGGLAGQVCPPCHGASRRVSLRHAARHHPLQPGAGLGGRALPREDVRAVFQPRRGGLREGHQDHHVHPRLRDHHLSAHRPRRTRPQVAGHPQASSDDAVDRPRVGRFLHALQTGHLVPERSRQPRSQARLSPRTRERARSCP